MSAKKKAEFVKPLSKELENKLIDRAVSAQHTPTPWIHQDQGMDSYTCIYDTRKQQGKIANVFGDGINEALANAAFIVSAVNAHQELVRRLDVLLKALDKFDPAMKYVLTERMNAKDALAKAEGRS